MDDHEPDRIHRDPRDPGMLDVMVPAGVSVTASVDGVLEIHSATPLDDSLIGLRREDVVSMVEAGVRPVIRRSLMGMLSLVPIAAPVRGGDGDEGPASGGSPSGQLKVSLDISSPTPNAEVQGPVKGVEVVVSGGAEVVTGMGTITSVEARVGDGAWVVATPTPPGDWGYFDCIVFIGTSG